MLASSSRQCAEPRQRGHLASRGIPDGSNRPAACCACCTGVSTGNRAATIFQNSFGGAGEAVLVCLEMTPGGKSYPAGGSLWASYPRSAARSTLSPRSTGAVGGPCVLVRPPCIRQTPAVPFRVSVARCFSDCLAGFSQQVLEGSLPTSSRPGG